MFRIGAVSPPIAMELTYKLRMEQPNIAFQTSFYSAPEILERLYNFDLDISILSQPYFDQKLHTQVYKRYPIVAVVRDDHPWVKEKNVRIKEIENQKLVLREAGSQTRNQVEKVCKSKNISINCVMQLNSREAIFHAIMQGIGIGFVVDVEYIDMPGLRPITFIDHPFFIEYHLCCLKIRKDRPMISEVFQNHILEVQKTSNTNNGVVL